ncbi:TPA: hypothetical protein ACPVXW_000435 [Vibrio parahaemolyticus]
MSQNIIEAIETSLKEGNFKHTTLYLMSGEDWRKYAIQFGVPNDLINLANLIEKPHSDIHSNPLFLAKWLVVRAEQVGSQRAYDDLIESCKISEVTAYNVSLITGVDFDGKIEFSDGAFYCGFQNLPESIKHNVNEKCMHISRMNGSHVHPPFTYLCSPIIYSNTPDGDYENRNKQIKTYVNKEHLIVNFLSLFSNSHAPYIEVRWCLLEDHYPLSGIVDTQATSQLESIRPKHYETWRELDIQYVQLLFNSYMKMEERLRLPIDISLSRRCQAMNTWNNVNKAIDLGIAVESVLTSPDTTVQLSLQIRILGSKLVGKNIDDRLRISALLNALYQVRSSAVHTGKLNTHYKVKGLGSKVQPNTILDEGIDILGRCLIAIIDMNGLSADKYEEIWLS